MDAKVYNDLQKHESEITVMRENSYIFVGGMTILAIILLLISYLTIHRNNLRISRYKKDAADLIEQLKQSVRENARTDSLTQENRTFHYPRTTYASDGNKRLCGAFTQ